MPHNKFNWLLLSWLKRPPKTKLPKPTLAQQTKIDATTDETPCCSNIVHIAYRGVSDDRLYLAQDRKWQEVKFFRPKGLRVFCKECRRRIY
jgi:hypothetical protein